MVEFDSRGKRHGDDTPRNGGGAVATGGNVFANFAANTPDTQKQQDAPVRFTLKERLEYEGLYGPHPHRNEEIDRRNRALFRAGRNRAAGPI